MSALLARPASLTSEKDFQNAVVGLAKTCGWRVAHFRPAQMQSGRWATAMQGDPGFPDLVLAGRGRVLFVELKRDLSAKSYRLTPAQIEWGNAIGRGGGDWHVWRPEDWPDIQRLLERGLEQAKVETDVQRITREAGLLTPDELTNLLRVHGATHLLESQP